MKLLLICALSFFLSLFAHGQAASDTLKDTTYIIRQDTINLKGVIYGYDGKPADNVEIGFFLGRFHPPGFPKSTQTDSKGNFELKGALPNDKLQIIDGRYIHVLFENRGSRFMVIYLPIAKVRTVNYDTILIKAIRKQPKVIPAFQIHDNGDRIFDGFTEAIYPYPEMGTFKFINYLRKNLVYPKKAIANNIEGTVEIGFQIAKNGNLYDLVILKGIGYGCDEMLINLIKKAGKWIPGITDGNYFSIQQTVTVRFSLTDK